MSEVVELEVKNENQQRFYMLSELIDDLRQYKDNLEDLQSNYSDELGETFVPVINATVAEMHKIEAKLRAVASEDKELSRKVCLLTTMPGIDENAAIVLLGGLQELGKASKTRIARHSGLVRMSDDGDTNHHRSEGRRRYIRVATFREILSPAIQHNERLKERYDRHVAAGKPEKVALNACLRNLIVWANAMIAEDQTWDASVDADVRNAMTAWD